MDSRLLGHFERSWDRQEKARRVLPAHWLADRRPAARELNDLFLDLLDRARERVSDERGRLERCSVSLGDVCD